VRSLPGFTEAWLLTLSLLYGHRRADFCAAAGVSPDCQQVVWTVADWRALPAMGWVIESMGRFNEGPP
jgi:hypothetical protein